TCAPNGLAGTNWPLYAPLLAGRTVYLLPDNDAPGRDHMAAAALALMGHAARLKLVELPDLPPGGDIVAFFQAGHTVDELNRIIQATPHWEPPGTLSIDDLLDEVLPPLRWIAQDIRPEGVLLLAGKPKLGKRWLALRLALDIAAGAPALGAYPTQRGDV